MKPSQNMKENATRFFFKFKKESIMLGQNNNGKQVALCP